MRVGDFGWYRLVDVPMFGDFPVIEAEDIDVGAAAGAGFADDVDVQDHVVAKSRRLTACS
jgi:hypothetical protein